MQLDLRKAMSMYNGSNNINSPMDPALDYSHLRLAIDWRDNSVNKDIVNY